MWLGLFTSLFICVGILVMYFIWFFNADWSPRIESSLDYLNKRASDMTEEDKKKYKDYKKDMEKKAKIKYVSFLIFPILLVIIIVTLITVMAANIERHKVNAEVEGYKMVKYTIEQSLENDNLTSLERIELVKQASEYNKWLGEAKYKVTVWYNFHLDEDNVLQLEEIKLDK